ncbi:Uncharacterised protein [Mesomycoplasma conjunctivae]|uniref:Uncharacterized protein n=1 Tax=Mesomycoplasma conjunctivae (strain ATCC 25834 / NCTC 10147 / HRC/581) TaxID=572263 RepID=C5J788_MESCH|nr:hypothetical protein [Mesomycoplasma conjunctivae]CAT05351.1 HYPOTHETICAL PROTEIN MCJ_006570 [Mesomycoplasma conjunctivae]VEU66578.1 Uncharacterised protein [Mesomycoplasma conjunctivae]
MQNNKPFVNQQINKMSFVYKKNLISQIFKLHKAAKVFNEKGRILDQLSISKEPYMQVQSNVDKVLEILDPKHSSLLIKEFIEQDKEWIEKYWSKSSYYKHIHKAIDEFIYYLYS